MNPFKVPRLPNRVSAGLVPLRIVAGLAFMFHGWGKIQNPTGWMPPDAGFHEALLAAAAISEFVGGAAWILGLLTPLFSLGLAGTMCVATWLHAVQRGDPFVGSPSYELALLYLTVAILLLLAGPGKFSLDRVLFGERGG